MPTLSQQNLVIVPTGSPPTRITFLPNTVNFFVGEEITITVYIHNTATFQNGCQVEFFVNRAGSSSTCDPVHIVQDVYNCPNPTSALVIDAGATVPVAFSWIVDQAYGVTSIFAQARATDNGPLDPCEKHPWNARKGCTIFSSFLPENARVLQPAVQNLYSSLGISNRGETEVHARLSVESLRGVESLREAEKKGDAIRVIEYLRGLGGSWLHAEPRQLKLALGIDRVTRPERGRTTRLERFKMLSPRVFEVSKNKAVRCGEPVLEAPLGAGEVRQVLLELEHSPGALKKDFYVVRVGHDGGESVVEDQLVVLRCDDEF